MDVIHAKSNRDKKSESALSGIENTPVVHRAQPPASGHGTDRGAGY
jgi:hypothetical protein